MRSYLRKLFLKLLRLPGSDEFSSINRGAEKSLLLNGQLLINQFDYSKEIKSFKDIEFSVFSQWGDDGIIQYLLHHIDVPSKTFVEFGVENYTESNTRFLLMNNNWTGLVLDSSKVNTDYIKNDSIS